MKIVYIAHPISGDIKANLEKIRLLVRQINLNEPNIVPFAPYWLDCHALNDNDPTERARGLKNGLELLKRGFINELWLCGNRISSGMLAEKTLAEEMGIPVINKLTL